MSNQTDSSIVSQQPTRPVESASASTACQTNDSKFCYVVTGVVLGVVALIALAATLLVFGALGYMGTLASSGYDYGDVYVDPHDGYAWGDLDDAWSGYKGFGAPDGDTWT